MSIFDEYKIDCHNHILDPVRFPYAPDTAYRPVGQEIGSRQQHEAVMDAYGIRHALIVEPNSGYGEDNRCLLDAVAVSQGRFKGIAVVPNDTPADRLLALKAQGVVGIAFNPSLQGLAYYENAKPLMRRLAELDMLVQVQVHADQMVALGPILLDSGAQILIDHCGRPDPARGLEQAGFQAVLALARSGRATVKLSGLQKFCADGWPFANTRIYVDALIETYGLDQCIWASDWPFLKASERVDVGPLLRWFEKLLPDETTGANFSGTRPAVCSGSTLRLPDSEPRMTALRMPALYLPHGGGPSFFMTGERKQRYQATEDFLRGIQGVLPSLPSAILIVTAHWETEVVSFTGAPQPALIYDYFGFPPETYALTYPAAGHPVLAARAAALLHAAGVPAAVDSQYGWDHGVFIPLKVMFPQADIPVVAMSLQASLDPALHCAMGRALQALRDEGVLILGAGMSYHNLGQFATAAPASFAFHDWLDEALTAGLNERTRLLSQWSTAPGGRASHPREEHLLPLMVASGAGSDAPARRLWRGTVGPSCLAAWAFD